MRRSWAGAVWLRGVWLGTICLALAACHRGAAPVAHPHYVLGPAWHAGGVWYYPAESYSDVQTGLAAVDPGGVGTGGVSARGGRRRLTADGEMYDADAPAAAHQTLQLPAIVRLTDLDNGRQMLVRLNDRGPASPARLVSVTPRVASRLGLRDGTPVRLEVMADASHQAVDAVGGGPRLAISTAPREAIQTETLPPPGAAPSPHGAAAFAGAAAATATAAPADVTLPGTVNQVPVGTVRLMLHLGDFTNPGPAGLQAAHVPGLGAFVVSRRTGRSTSYSVVAGPYPDARAAEAALDHAMRAGVSDARIVARTDADEP